MIITFQYGTKNQDVQQQGPIWAWSTPNITSSVYIFQPKGAGTPHQEGNIVIQAPRAVGFWGTANYTITGYPISVDGVPTGEIGIAYSGRFDDTDYYTS